jgi:uncharacterized protein YcfL
MHEGSGCALRLDVADRDSREVDEVKSGDVAVRAERKVSRSCRRVYWYAKSGVPSNGQASEARILTLQKTASRQTPTLYL